MKRPAKKALSRQDLERNIAVLEARVTELQALGSAQVTEIRDLNKTVINRTETILVMMEASCEVGVEGERLYVYGSTLAVERVRGLVHQLGLRAMKVQTYAVNRCQDEKGRHHDQAQAR